MSHPLGLRLKPNAYERSFRTEEPLIISRKYA